MPPAYYYGGLLSEPHISCTIFVFIICINWSLVWKNVHHKWCEEKLVLCLSASTCSFHFLYHNTIVSKILAGGKTQEKSYSIPLSDCLSPKADQTLGLGYTVDNKTYSRAQSQYWGVSVKSSGSYFHAVWYTCTLFIWGNMILCCRPSHYL